MGFRELPVRSGGNDPNIDPDFPFKANLLTDSDDDILRGVSFYSYLFDSRDYEDRITINGLLTNGNPKSNDSGWGFTTQSESTGPGNSADRVWLQIQYNTDPKKWPEIVSCSIFSDFVDGGAQWAGGEIEYVKTTSKQGDSNIDVYTQKYARVILGLIQYDGSQRKIVVDQRVRTHLRLALYYDTGFDSDGNNPQTIGVKMPVAFP